MRIWRTGLEIGDWEGCPSLDLQGMGLEWSGVWRVPRTLWQLRNGQAEEVAR